MVFAVCWEHSYENWPRLTEMSLKVPHPRNGFDFGVPGAGVGVVIIERVGP
jgi:hypothetical protein